MAIYALSNAIIFSINSEGFNSYAYDNITHSWSLKWFAHQTTCAYVCFACYILKGTFCFVNSSASAATHMLMILLIFIEFIMIRHKKKVLASVVSLLLIFLLPLSINGLFLVANNRAVHSLTQYSFVTVYIFFIVLTECALESDYEYIKAPKTVNNVKNAFLYLSSAMLSLVLCFNVCTANQSYLNLDLTLKNTTSFYTSLVTQIKSTPGFNENTKVALIGNNNYGVWDMNQFDNNSLNIGIPNFLESKINKYNFSDSRIMGILRSNELINNSNIFRCDFIKYFIGFDVDFATDEEIKNITKSQEYKDMNSYPYYGSVKMIDDYLVVKLE